MKFDEPKCAFKLSGGHVETDGSIRGKITGTNLSQILGKSPFTSPFRAACALLGVARENIDHKQSVEIGKYLEDKLIAYCAERYPEYGSFIPAEQVFAKREGDHDMWPSDWEDDLYSGHLDGVVMSEDGNYVLEVKTSGNMDAWAHGVPEYYCMQVELYNHFMYQKPVAYVILGLVSDETRKDVTSWKPNDKEVYLFKVDLDDEAFEETLEKAEEWYSTYIMNGITPDYDPTDPKDVETWNYLMAISAPDSEIQSDMDRIEELRVSLKEKEEAIAPLKDELEDLQKKVKDYMVATNKLELKTSGKTLAAVITHSDRTTVDKKKLVSAGIDPTPYLTTTHVVSISFKEPKE